MGVCVYKQYLTFGSDLFLIEFRTMSQSLARGNVHAQVHLKASVPTSTKAAAREAENFPDARAIKN